MSERDLFLLVALSGAVFGIAAYSLGDWQSLVLNYADNDAYSQVATALRHWNFHEMPIQQFMGYPYFIAAISLIFRVPIWIALSLVAWIASAITVYLAARLFGTWVAAYFALSNFAWLQLSFLGGSEPLAMALGFGAFYLFRRGCVVRAALLGALAVTVRPLMIFVLVGIGLVLLARRQWWAFVAALLTSLTIGALYVWPLAHYLGDPLRTVHSYTSRDYGATNVTGPHGNLFGWPFHGIVMGTITYPAPWSNLLLSFFWVGLVVAGIVAMFSSRFRVYVLEFPEQGIFCALYLLGVFSYDYLIWARSNFIRFSIPALPFVFFALMPWLLKSKRVLLLLSVVSPILAACSAVGIKNVLSHAF